MNSLGREPQDGGKKKTEAAERRQIPRRDSCGSRLSPGLSPLRGSFIYGGSVPGAHAPGYESFAAPRLTSAGLAIPETLGFHLGRFLGPPHRIPDEPNGLFRNCVRSRDGRRRAPKGRQMNSLGREPQEPRDRKFKPRSGDRYMATTAAAHAAAPVCRPSGAMFVFRHRYPGLTPRAKYLSPLRGSHLARFHRPTSSNSG
jgi:hypothetical protein